MKLKFIVAATLAATLGSSIASAGEDVGWYVLGAAGWSNVDSDLHDKMGDSMTALQQYASKNGVGTYGKTTTKENSVALKIVEGYRFNDYFAVEGGYYYLGRAKSDTKVDALNNCEGCQYKAHAKIKGHMLALDAVGILPINDRFELFAKAGAGLVFGKVTFNEKLTIGDNYNDSDSFSKSKTRIAPKLGVGAEWFFVENWALRWEYERVWNAVKAEGLKTHYNLFTMGVKYLF